MKGTSRFVAAGGLVLGMGLPAHADIIIHESAIMGSPGWLGGSALTEEHFLGSRFHVDATLEVTKIGGHLAHVQSHPGDLFGAIISLSGPDALPAGSPFSDDEVVAKTLFHGPIPSTDFRTPLSATLGPGDYALIFGSGQFGATGWGIMPSNNQDLPGASYIRWYGDSWSNSPVSGYRFVVEGLPTVPGDGDGDGDVDLGDFAVLADCLAGPDQLPDPTWPTTSNECLHDFDFDEDGDVDLDDFGVFQVIFGSLAPCEYDEDCDDALFCNGQETCVDGGCQAGANPCGPGDVCSEETETCHALEDDNPDVDFQDLLVGHTYALVAPIPPGGETCTCAWSVDPPTAGTFSPPDACLTDLTILEEDDLTLNVIVSCDGLDPVEYRQDAWARVGPPPDAILDQEQAEQNSWASAVGFDWQQEVTAGIAGPLIGVDIWVKIGDFEDCQSVDFFINKGPPWQTDANDFETVLCAGPNRDGWVYVDTSAASITLEVGQEFVVGLLHRSEQFFFRLSTQNPYPGGSLWVNESEQAGNDMAFRSYTAP